MLVAELVDGLVFPLGQSGKVVTASDAVRSRLRGCAVARLRGCAVARLRGCEIRLEINSITYGKALVEPVQKYQAISAGNVLHQPKA